MKPSDSSGGASQLWSCRGLRSVGGAAIALFLLMLFVIPIGAAPTDDGPPGETAPAEVPERHDVGYFEYGNPLVAEGVSALAKWDLAAADKVAEKLEAEGKSDEVESMVFLSRLAFFHGDYVKCKEINDLLISEHDYPGEMLMAQRVNWLARAMGEVKSYESEHFIVHVTPGPDEILPYDALDTMEKAYAVLTKDLQVEPTSKVVLEVFPDFQSFEAATGLSAENVETSGTIAVCKYGRLMVTTPRASLRGYAWRDTMAHEFVHYLIFLRAGYSCPIWLHEGIAKYEEKRWRMDEGGWLPPTSQTLLAAALDDDNLITFEEMEPSFAMLPSPAAGQIAFAEVTMCVKYLVQRGGFDLVLRLLDRLQKDDDWKKAIKAELGESDKAFIAKWKKFMRSVDLERVEGIDIVGVKIRKTDEPEEESEQDVSDDMEEDSPAYKYSRLGELLEAEGRLDAALLEYKKAVDAAPNSLHLLNKTAFLYMANEDFDSALPLLLRAGKLYPESYPATYKRLGIIYRAKGEPAKAAEYYERSADINPYDPEVQSALWKLYGELKIEDRRLEAERKLAILVPEQ